MKGNGRREKMRDLNGVRESFLDSPKAEPEPRTLM